MNDKDIFRDEREFRKIVERLDIDVSTNIEHRNQLRERMLCAFKETEKTDGGSLTLLAFLGRIKMSSSITKIVIAAALIIAAGIGIHHITQPEPKILDYVAEEPTTAEESQEKLVAIEIELPKPMFVGTPQDTRTPHLERPSGKPRPPFLAPVGTRNLALGKPVTSSDEEPIIGELSMITDDDKEAADGSYVELGPFAQQITIDLETEANIYAIVIWHYHKMARVYFDIVVQVADDPDFITNVQTVFNNDYDNTLGLGIGKDLHYTETNEGKLIDCLSKGVRGRYVRLYSNGNTGNDLNHYIEVAVYGKEVK